MSIAKRIMFENDPRDDAYRADRRRQLEELQKRFTVRIATRRKNPLAGRGRWDPIWPWALSRAATELGVPCIAINGGLFVESHVDVGPITARAEAHYKKGIEL